MAVFGGLETNVYHRFVLDSGGGDETQPIGRGPIMVEIDDRGETDFDTAALELGQVGNQLH